MSAAPLTSRTSSELVVTVTGPHAADGAATLDPWASEPRTWTVQSSQPLDEPPDIAIGHRLVWHPTEWAGDGSVRLVLAGPHADQPGETVPVVAGASLTWVRARRGDVVLVRPAGTLHVA